MAIQYVGGQTQALGTGDTTVTFSLAGGLASTPADGDVVIVSVALINNSDAAIGVVTSGYTEIAEIYANDSGDTNLSLSWKRMGSSPDASVVVTGKTSGSNSGVAIVQVYRGVDATTAFDVTSTTATGIDSAIPNPPSITPTTAGALIVVAGANTHSRGAAGTLSASYLANFVTLVDATGTFADGTSGMGDVAWTSGAYDPAAWTFGASDSTLYSNASVTMALRPASDAVAAPTTGEVTATGAAPTASAAATASCAAGAVAASGLALTATAAATGEPALGSVAVDGFAPTAIAGSDIVAATGTGTVAGAGQAPSAAAGAEAVLALGGAAATGLAPIATAGAESATGTGAVDLLGSTPTVSTEDAAVGGVAGMVAYPYAQPIFAGEDRGGRKRYPTGGIWRPR